ncbi:hypothetical protein F4805DRAFT_416485 [Annulohypoxylon moriforme]|nr:hypothetical protein F4805DRAFT_416485 [Annulohypoxylon moriforme]
MDTSKSNDNSPTVPGRSDDNFTKDYYHDVEADYSDSEDEERFLEVKEKFDRILASLRSVAKDGQVKSGMLDLTTLAGVRALMNKERADLGKRVAKRQTLLHLIAESSRKQLPPAEKMKHLITELVQLPDNLLVQQDDNGKTPLFCAITNRRDGLVELMCQAHYNIDNILKIPKSAGQRSANCIHEAIMKRSSSTNGHLLKTLLGRAKADTLLAKEENGLTPLHLAVEYNRCDDSQLEIVQALVEGCESVLDMTYDHPEKGPLSPYLYHEFTHQEAKEKHARERKNEQSRDREVPQNKKRELTKTNLKEPLFLEERVSNPFQSKTTDGIDPASHAPYQRDFGVKPAGLNGIVRRETVSLSEKKPSSRRAKTSRLKPTETGALAIKQYLKLEYLRKRNHDDAAVFLYGTQKGKHIYFDLSGVSSKVNKQGITSGLSHLILENILQYVSIPRVEVEDDSIGLKPGRRAPKPDGNGRTDMMHIFKWLRDEKKVETILRVIVDDLQEPAHSDETIEACLIGMGIEIWEWKRFDLSLEVIQNVAPEARVVHLYWSGNNTVLRGWSESEALEDLEKLEKIYLHIQQGLETNARTKKNAEAFRERIAKRIRNRVIEVSIEKLPASINNGTVNGTNPVDDHYKRHKWVTSMEEFADFLQAAERNIDPPITLKHPITIAIIDDGVDISDQSIQSRVVDGKSFYRRDEEQNLNQPYYMSGGGHGTAMAKFICKVCPNVQLYILRLDEYFIEPDGRQITAESAAKAVRAAVDKRVDIISMSWTIERTDGNKEAIDDLGAAISLASSRNILMFCAATDQGAYKDKTYPAASDTKKIFKIGAAKASGMAMNSVDQSLVDFIFPGHKVMMERYDDPNVKSHQPRTGSSVATAFASALAAVILYCVQLANTIKYANRPNEFNAYRSLKDHERMKEAFSQIGTTKESDNKYITVWSRFTYQVKKAEQDSAPKDRYIDYIVALADDLMRRA